MEERINEGKIIGSIDAITLGKTEKIAQQMKTCICQVYADKKIGTGFFCKIPYENENIPVLMTNYHIINDDFLKNNEKIKITINDEKIFDTIDINEKSKIYSSEINKYDIMIIKLEEKKDIYQYLELDDNLFKEDSEQLYEDKSIYLLHYPMGYKISVSYGYGIQKDDEYCFKHSCNTEHCSSGFPILNLKTNKVIGIHCGSINIKKKEAKFNIGVLLKHPLNELNRRQEKKEIEITKKNELEEKNKKIEIEKSQIIEKNELKLYKKNNIVKTNEIKLIINIDKEDVNKDIYFLDNTKYKELLTGIKHYHDNLKELNESNTELYINDKKYNYKKYFKPDKEGIYMIK